VLTRLLAGDASQTARGLGGVRRGDGGREVQVRRHEISDGMRTAPGRGAVQRRGEGANCSMVSLFLVEVRVWYASTGGLSVQTAQHCRSFWIQVIRILEGACQRSRTSWSPRSALDGDGPRTLDTRVQIPAAALGVAAAAAARVTQGRPAEPAPADF
jgi:hypothetical protein